MIFYAILIYTLFAIIVHGQPVNTLQSVQVAAQLARRVVSDAGIIIIIIHFYLVPISLNLFRSWYHINSNAWNGI